MKKSLFFWLMLMIAFSLSAQKQMNIWSYGQKLSLNIDAIDSITFETSLPPSGWRDVYIIDIDSAITCCGIDSFTIESPWIQEYINAFIADTARMYELPTLLRIDHYVDSNNNDFFREQYEENRNRLYDCEGNILEEKRGYNVINLPKDAEEYKTIVYIEIGRNPNI